MKNTITVNEDQKQTIENTNIMNDKVYQTFASCFDLDNAIDDQQLQQQDHQPQLQHQQPQLQQPQLQQPQLQQPQFPSQLSFEDENSLEANLIRSNQMRAAMSQTKDQFEDQFKDEFRTQNQSNAQNQSKQLKLGFIQESSSDESEDDSEEEIGEEIGEEIEEKELNSQNIISQRLNSVRTTPIKVSKLITQNNLQNQLPPIVYKSVTYKNKNTNDFEIWSVIRNPTQQQKDLIQVPAELMQKKK